MREIIEAALDAGRRGTAAVLATVVKVEGSAYRRPGARMLLPRDGPPVGLVSGGCLEGDLAERAQAVLESGRAHTVVYDMRSPDDIVWGLGLGCNGEVRVLLECLDPARTPGWLAIAARCAGDREPFAVVTVFEAGAGLEHAVGARCTLAAGGDSDGTAAPAPLHEALLARARLALSERRSAVESLETAAGRVEVLAEFLPPRTGLAVFGAGNDAQPVVRIAAELGWRVIVVDDRPAYASPERFPRAESVQPVRFDALAEAGLGVDAATPALVMTHHFLHDLDILEFLLASDAPYVGVLGPRRRTRNLLDELARRGVRPSPERLACLYGPVGIDIGSETPEEIALAALAEIRAVLSDRAGGFLRDRSGPLHDWPR